VLLEAPWKLMGPPDPERWARRVVSFGEVSS
jgi:hypothetical protein